MVALSTFRKFRACIFVLLVLLTLLHPSFALPIFAVAPVKCKLADFKTVIFFFLANYASHAFTVPSMPGGNWRWSLVMKLTCIFHPFAGLLRSVALLINHWCQGDRGSVGDAAAQGAMMVAARSPNWRPAEYWERIFVRITGLGYWPPENSGSSTGLPTQKVKLEIQEFPRKYSTRAWFYHLLGSRIHEDLDRMIESMPTTPMLAITDLDVHGESKLPDGYHWIIPSIGKLNDLTALLEQPQNIKVARSRSWLKGLIALGQLVFSSITIYQARGDQLVRYGYAAFGLSVFPYTLMSLVNLIVTAIIGEYSHLSILRTAISDEAKQRPGSRISGEVGTFPVSTQSAKEETVVTGEGHGTNIGNATPTLDEHRPIQAAMSREHHEQVRRNARPVRLRAETKGDDMIIFIEIDGISSQFLLVDDGNEEDVHTTLYIDADACSSDSYGLLEFFVSEMIGITVVVFLYLLPYIFIFLLTKFQKGHSTRAERAWMMTWLVFNQWLIPLGAFTSDAGFITIIPLESAIPIFIFVLIHATPALGGFVMVGKMLLESSPCAISE